MKKRIVGISGAVSFVVFLILFWAVRHVAAGIPEQQMAGRWSGEGEAAAQVSCFFSVNSGITSDRIEELEHSVDGALAEASVVQESENPGARLWADAYSASGTITMVSDRASLEADAVGIGGDFFLFHPLKLLSGSYFSGNDVMKDYCIIDEDAAWQLFGSSNVAGMYVYINGIPHMVAGVAERPRGRLEEGAGLDGPLVYVSYESLEQLGQNHGINCFEIVMPNPVTGFAEKFVRDNLGSDERETEVVENTSRYSFLPRLKLVSRFGLRSMNGRAIIYPYWENIARGYEDILALVTLFEMVFLLYAVGTASVLAVIWWRHKGWTVKEKALLLKDKAERFWERAREKRREHRQEKKAGKMLERSENKTGPQEGQGGNLL